MSTYVFDDSKVAAEERYGLYELRDGQPHRVATMPELECIGVALATLAADRRERDDIEPYPVVGVLDRIERTWLAGLWHPRAT